MNRYVGPVRWSPADAGNRYRSAFAFPVITCLLGLESKNFNDLVLIPFCVAHATRAGGSPRVAQAIRTAGPAASQTPGGACPISVPGG